MRAFGNTPAALTCVVQPREVKAEQPAQQNNWARNLKIGAAAVAGGTLLAVTGFCCVIMLMSQHTGPYMVFRNAPLSCSSAFSLPHMCIQQDV